MKDEWAIGIYQGRSPLSLAPSGAVQAPVLTKKDVLDVQAEYVADPFMISVNQTWYLFFEILNSQNKKGQIGFATSLDGHKWTYRQVVLNEPFHLSYPYVFEWEGEIYMVPETFETNSIRLYKANPFPHQWSFITTLVTGKGYVDPSLFWFQSKWWMFASGGIHPFRAEDLHLFVADDLQGPWREHPKSPVVRGDMKIARPGGRVITFQNKVFRYTQDCAETYGRQVRAFEIVELTPDLYAEQLVCEKPILGPTKRGWNEMGMHHVDPHLLPDGRWLACVDGWRWIQADA